MAQRERKVNPKCEIGEKSDGRGKCRGRKRSGGLLTAFSPEKMTAEDAFRGVSKGKFEEGKDVVDLNARYSKAKDGILESAISPDERRVLERVIGQAKETVLDAVSKCLHANRYVAQFAGQQHTTDN